MNTYRAEFEDDDIEIFRAENDDEAITEAFSFESEHGTLFNVLLVDNDTYDEIKTIF